VDLQKTSVMTRRVGLLMLAAFAVVAANSATLQVRPGPFKSGKAYISCGFDGIQQNCFLDTGSAMTLVAGREFSGYGSTGNFQFKSASEKPRDVETILIHRTRIDDLSFANITVGRLGGTKGLESSIGIDFIGRQPFSLQFRNTPSLQLNPTPPQQTNSGLSVDPHRLLSVPMACNGQAIRGLWDTGTGVTAIDQAYIKMHPEEFEITKDYMQGTDGTGHSMLVKAFEARKITIGSRTFRNVKIVAVDLSLLRKHVNREIQAVIGFNLIRKADWFFDPEKKNWSMR
jgi:hypothetical protein